MSKPSSQLPWASYLYGIQCRLIQAAEQQYGDIVLSISKHAYPITLEITGGKEAALSGIWIQFVTEGSEESVKLINVVLLPLGPCQLQKIVPNASAAFYPSLCFKEKRATCNPACWHTQRCIEEHTGNNVTSTGWPQHSSYPRRPHYPTWTGLCQEKYRIYCMVWRECVWLSQLETSSCMRWFKKMSNFASAPCKDSFVPLAPSLWRADSTRCASLKRWRLNKA